MATLGDNIRKRAIEIIRSEPAGIRFSALVNRLHNERPDWNVNTINGSIWNLDVVVPSQIAKPARGVYVTVEQQEKEAEPEPAIVE